jgi:hypothetical protein
MLLNTKSHIEIALKQYHDELFQADLAKKIAESVLKSVNGKLQDKKNEVSYYKSNSAKGFQGNDSSDKPKNFLASEGLASAKKQSSVTPVKNKKLKKRSLSVSKKN